MKKENYDWGKSEPFFPDFIFKEALAALAVFLVLLFIVVFTHVPLEPVADPTDASYVPRPEWYFMSVFQLLKYFPGELEPVAVFVGPTIGILVLLFLPFLDRRKERVPARRPIAMAAAAIGLVGMLYLTAVAIQTTPPPVVTAQVQAPKKLTVAENAGKKLYQDQGCAGCHQAGGKGPIPDLSRIGSVRDAEYLKTYVKNPKDINPAAIMPPFASLSEEQLTQMSQYLAGLK